MDTISRFFIPPKGSFFLFGPRGTGKSTWLRRTMPEATFIDLLAPESFRAYSARPERLREIVEACAQSATVVIDEVQKVPALLDVVHQFIEGSDRRRFVLTGSSARKLKRSGVDLLAGRAVLKTMHPFMAGELGNRFDLERSLRLGMLPLVLAADDPSDTLRSYAALYVREEVMAEGLVRNIGGFARFLEAVSFSHGAVLSIAQVSRDCQINRKTVEGHLNVLEDMLLGFRLQVFRRKAKRQLTHHPKFYYADTGVFRSLRPSGPLDSTDEISGAALEGLVAQHLRAWMAYSGGDHQLFYWRTKSGLEVDFVVYGPETLAAIEVKNAKRIYNADVRSLKSFLDDYPQAKAIMLYRGKERLKIGKVLCIPTDDFLLSLVPGAPIVE